MSHTHASKFPAHPRRLLVIPLRYIGDTILTVPLLRNLRHHFATAQIDVLASATAAPLLTPCPYLNHVLLEPASKAELTALLKRGQYDAVFLLRKSVSMAWQCKRAGIPVIVGYDKQRFPWGYKRWGWFIDIPVRYPSLKTTTPQAVSHLQLLSTIGHPAADQHLELWTQPEDNTVIDELLHECDLTQLANLAVLHAASASHGKTLDIEKFRTAAHTLVDQGYRLLFTGTQSDRAMYEHLMAHDAKLADCINLAGKTSLRQTVALYRRIQVLVTVDSSPLHMGLAVGVPHIVTAYGPTNERQWGYYDGVTPPSSPNPSRFAPVFVDLSCRPCYAKVCSHNNCRMMLSGEQIDTTLRQTLQITH